MAGRPVPRAAATLLLAFALLALLAPWIAPYSPAAQDLELGSVAPNATHWLGTDIFGRDLLTRLLYAGRLSLAVAVAATAVALCVGLLWGASAGWFGGRTDTLLMRTVDVLYALPFSVIVILLTVVFGRSLLVLLLAIGAVEWLTLARIVRGQVLALRQREFIEAAVVMGLTKRRILVRHLIPNLSGPVAVYTTLMIPHVILLESFLAFLGLGVMPPHSSLGSLIGAGVEVIEEYPWQLLFPALALSLALLALNAVGDALRDAFDPRA
jgi:oligopeptide transport system permease protein